MGMAYRGPVAKAKKKTRRRRERRTRPSCRIGVPHRRMDRTQRLFSLMDALRPASPAGDGREPGARTVRLHSHDLSRRSGAHRARRADRWRPGLAICLRPGFFLPPLMFSEDELEALMRRPMGRAARATLRLTQAARNAARKIATATPKDLRDTLDNTGLWVAPTPPGGGSVVDIKSFARPIRRERKLRIAYVTENGTASERAIWPIALAFFERRQTVAAWCELRNGFRHFRTDRMTAVAATPSAIRAGAPNSSRAWRREQNISE